ncbi:hypothetical protein ONZ43_g2155 [Nemania bipapillata]|uniref:Uncharacterized protein n=1 Tax=Nemania bipapillata TaxID=110536 RepID=A0ACC2J202_9PEZI|nr:hypothetical protein ONZ43_g2155 [Nemania bipapillata]
MSFQLHVWGLAFGLESIDPECLAAIAAFRHILREDEWSLIASNDTSLSPDPDKDLTPQQQADLLAYTSYLSTRGSGLVSLSLYASPNAWVELTRPAYSALLPFPLTWTIPTVIRAAAIEKAESLGMGYLAAEAEADEAAVKGGAETMSTGFLRLREQLGPRKSMQPEQTAAIRFQQLADDFFTTLDDLRGDNPFFLGTPGASSLDFLAYGTMGTFADGTLENIAGVGESWRRWRRGGIKSEEEGNAQNSAGILLALGGAVVSLTAVGAAVLFRGLAPFGASTHRFEAPKQEMGLYRFGEIGTMLESLPIFERPPTASSSIQDRI